MKQKTVMKNVHKIELFKILNRDMSNEMTKITITNGKAYNRAQKLTTNGKNDRNNAQSKCIISNIKVLQKLKINIQFVNYFVQIIRQQLKIKTSISKRIHE